MRLLRLNHGGGFSLVERLGNDIPRYAILSHTWGSDEEEVLFADIVNNSGSHKAGYQKLRFCGEQAKRDRLEYFWVDTCCIDKTSSSELTEAINSMFRWYQQSDRCYVYLSDVSRGSSGGNDDVESQRWKPAFRKSRWFTRGWTLQELLAPRSVEFFSKEGIYLGSKESMESTIHEITKIPVTALQGTPLCDFDKGERFSWASNRTTKREEDEAYCLFGIFDIYLPLIYGEQKNRAFARLEEQIDKSLYGRGCPTDERKEKLLEALRFDQIDARQMTIKTAHAKTCKWLLRKAEYLDWIEPSKRHQHNGFLWIKGKPGTGKSTIMKYICGHWRKKKDPVVLSFFFNARGEELEKSIMGTFRSLLVQLLEHFPNINGLSESMLLSAMDASQWSIEALKTIFKHAVLSIGDSMVFCFIDALDECEENQVRDMISFLEHLGELTTASELQFHVCFSSRHYPHITIQRGLDLVLEGQEGHTQDIANYLTTELKIGKNKIAQEVRADIQEKASGIFMWVILVTEILNREYDRGRIHALRRKLRDIPKDLHELFRNILTRDTDNRDELILCIQWVLFSKRPLSPEELYFAIRSGSEPDTISAWDEEEIMVDGMRRFILNSSKGLTEITASKNPKVQFIHESVRDFLLKDGLNDIWPELGEDINGHSHEQLKRCCLNYINMDAIISLEIPDNFGEPGANIDSDFRYSTTKSFPLLEYAIRHLLYHADSAEGTGISQTHFLESFAIPQWIRLNNIFEKHKLRRHTSRVSLLYLLGENNMTNLLATCQFEARQCLEVEDERYGPPIFAAIATASREATTLFLDKLFTSQGVGSYATAHDSDPLYPECNRKGTIMGRDFRYTMKRSPHSTFLYAANFGYTSIMSSLISSGMFNINFYTIREMLFEAIKNGRDNIVKVLLENGLDPNAWNKGKTALCVASEHDFEEAVKLLLEYNADPNAREVPSNSPLFVASAKGHERIVKLLLQNNASHTERNDRDSPLYIALLYGHERTAKLLQDSGANIDPAGTAAQHALWNASESGYDQTVVRLLKNNVDPNTGYENETSLCAASRSGHIRIVGALLEYGADPNTEGKNNSTALVVASSKDHEEVVKMLLKKGADPNVTISSPGGLSLTALYKASELGHERVAKLLLEHGAKINVTGSYLSALWIASVNGHEQIVRLLLENGADVNVSGNRDSAICAAANTNRQEVVKLLLEKGADLTTEGGEYALNSASDYGHEQVVRLLLENGADVNGPNEHYNPLRSGWGRGRLGVVKILLQHGAHVRHLNSLYGSQYFYSRKFLFLDETKSLREEVAKLLRERGAREDIIASLRV